MNNMRIAIDAMGTDLGPAEIVKGVVRASIELQACGRAVYTLVGDENTLLSELQSLDVACGTIRIQHASEVIGMHAQPSRAIRGNNSILVAAKMAASGEADAFVTLIGHRLCLIYHVAKVILLPSTWAQTLRALPINC